MTTSHQRRQSSWFFVLFVKWTTYVAHATVHGTRVGTPHSLYLALDTVFQWHSATPTLPAPAAAARLGGALALLYTARPHYVNFCARAPPAVTPAFPWQTAYSPPINVVHARTTRVGFLLRVVGPNDARLVASLETGTGMGGVAAC